MHVKPFQTVLIGNSCKIGLLENANHQFHLQPRPCNWFLSAASWSTKCSDRKAAPTFESFLHNNLVFYDLYHIILVFCEILCLNWKKILEARSFFFIMIKYNTITNDPNPNCLQLTGKRLSSHTSIAALSSEAWTKSKVRHTGGILHYQGQAPVRPSEWSLRVSSKSLCT